MIVAGFFPENCVLSGFKKERLPSFWFVLRAYHRKVSLNVCLRFVFDDVISNLLKLLRTYFKIDLIIVINQQWLRLYVKLRV